MKIDWIKDPDGAYWGHLVSGGGDAARIAVIRKDRHGYVIEGGGDLNGIMTSTLSEAKHEVEDEVVAFMNSNFWR